MKTYKLSLLIALFLCGALQALAGKDSKEFSKKFEKEFTVNNNVSIDLANKFGRVEVITWSENRVRIEVVVKVDASEQGKADQLLEDIEVEIEGNAERVSVETMLLRKNFKSNLLAIDYKVQMPATGDLNIENSFGDVVITALSGKLDVDLSYGSFKMGKLEHPGNKLYLEFMKGSIDELQAGNLILAYSELNLFQSKSIEVESESSTLNIAEAESLKLESSYDNYHVGTLKSLIAETEFTILDIKSVMRDIDLENEYGSVKIAEIAAGFESINIDSELANVILGFADNNFDLQATAEFANVVFPKTQSMQVKTEDFTSKSYNGSMNGQDNASLVKIVTEYGNVKIKIAEN